MITARNCTASGFSFVELAISLSIFVILLGSIFSITAQASGFVRDNDIDVFVQGEGNRAYKRFAEVLRKSGRITAGGVAYPRVTTGGAELEFKVLTDLDGNGYAFDDATGALEWDPAVYTVKAGVGGDLAVYRGATVVHPLARFVQNLRFQTISENAALHLKEISISFEVRKQTDKGFDMIQPVAASVNMRN